MTPLAIVLITAAAVAAAAFVILFYRGRNRPTPPAVAQAPAPTWSAPAAHRRLAPTAALDPATTGPMRAVTPAAVAAPGVIRTPAPAHLATAQPQPRHPLVEDTVLMHTVKPRDGRHAARTEGGGNVLHLLRTAGAITHTRRA